MGHQRDATFQSYISRVSGVDTQAIMLNRPQRQDLMDYVQSIAPFIDLNAANSRSSANLAAPIVEGPRVRSKRLTLKAKRVQQIQKERRMIRKDEESTPEGDRRSNSRVGPYDKIVRSGPAISLKAYLKYDANRLAVVERFYERPRGHRLSIEDAIRPLVELANPRPLPFHYPRAAPDCLGQCTICGVAASK